MSHPPSAKPENTISSLKEIHDMCINMVQTCVPVDVIAAKTGFPVEIIKEFQGQMLEPFDAWWAGTPHAVQLVLLADRWSFVRAAFNGGVEQTHPAKYTSTTIPQLEVGDQVVVIVPQPVWDNDKWLSQPTIGSRGTVMRTLSDSFNEADPITQSIPHPVLVRLDNHPEQKDDGLRICLYLAAGTIQRLV